MNQPAIRDLLTPQLRAQLDLVTLCASKLWPKGTPAHPLFTLHGVEHSQRVEQIVGDILAPEHRGASAQLPNAINTDQLFYLLASVWLHDLGMANPAGTAEIESAHQANIHVAEWIREHHHELSDRYIEANWHDLGLLSEQAHIVRLVCRAHRRENLSQISQTYPNIRLLGAVLRVADELDITSTRAPESLMDAYWNQMDNVSRWHWIKHWCVMEAEPYHEEDKHTSYPSISLTYHQIVRLPDPKFQGPFIDKVMSPIKRVMIDEGADLILSRYGMSIKWEGFQQNLLCEDRSFPDGTTLKSLLSSMLSVRSAPTTEMLKVVEKLQGRMTPAGMLLRDSLERLCELLSSIQQLVAARILTISQAYLSAASTASIADRQEAMGQYLGEADRVVDQAGLADAMRATLSRAIASTADLTFRVVGLVQDSPAERIKHLIHLRHLHGAGICRLATWIATDSTEPASVREAAVNVIEQVGTDESYPYVLKASKDPDPSVRAAAMDALSTFRDPQSLQRLAEVMGNDVDGRVREQARKALNAIAYIRPAHREFEGRRVAVLDDEPWLTRPLVDQLIDRGIEVFVSVDMAEVERRLHEWKPDLVVCEWFPDRIVHAADSISNCSHVSLGLVMSRLVRRALGYDVALLVTSVQDIGENLAEMLELRAVYVKKPITVNLMLRSIESILPHTQPALADCATPLTRH